MIKNMAGFLLVFLFGAVISVPSTWFGAPPHARSAVRTRLDGRVSASPFGATGCAAASVAGVGLKFVLDESGSVTSPPGAKSVSGKPHPSRILLPHAHTFRTVRLPHPLRC
jgi:hypothetical protein